jgi:hypothetical protein
MTQVRKNPATTEVRLATVHGLNRLVSCIQRTNNSRSPRRRGQRAHAPPSTPHHEHVQIRTGVLPGDALQPCQIGTHGQPQRIGRHHNRTRTRRRSEGIHAPTIRPPQPYLNVNRRDRARGRGHERTTRPGLDVRGHADFRRRRIASARSCSVSPSTNGRRGTGGSRCGDRR